SSSNAAKTRAKASTSQSSSSINDAEDEGVNLVAGKTRKGSDENGQPEARASDTLASFSANSAANTLTSLLLTAAWLALAI
ncbi:hypothetical protein H4S01_001773, partial [Coemansia sp. RSA 2610]